MALNDEMYKQYLRQKQLEEYNKKKKELNSQRQINGLSKIKSFYDNINSNGNKLSNFGQTMSQSQNGAVANLGNKLQSFGNRLQSFGQPSTTAVNNPITSSIGSEVGSNALSNSLLSATGGAGASEGASAIGSAIGKAAPSATSLAGTGGAGLSSVAGAAGKAAPFLGAGISGAQAAQDASKGDYIGAGLNGIAAGASFVPGVGTAVAMGAQALDKVNKMFRAAKDKANAKAMQQSMEELQKSEQANDESLAGLQDAFQNDSEQAAQNMTLPTNNQALSQDIMSQINPDYTASASGSPTGFAANINTPDDTQTLQNDQSVVPQVEDVNGNVSAFPTTREAFAKSLTDNGWTEDVVNSALQGLNGGNKDMADYISAYNNNAPDDQKIAIPQTNEEIELAKNGQFYQPQGNTQNNNTQLKEGLLERIKNGLSNFKEGYEDNSMNGFANGDLANKLAGNTQQPTIPQDGVLTGGAAQTKKTLMNRIGEAAGTGRRLMANPWAQAAIAGLVSKAAGGDIDDMAIAAYQYGTNKAKADDYYRKMNPNAKVMPVFNNYTADDYKAKAYNDYNQMRTEINAPTADEYYKQQFLQNYLTADEYNKIINDPNYDPSARVNLNQVKQAQKNANDVRKTDIQADKNNWQKSQGQQKVNIQAQNANEKKRHNGVTEKQNGQKIDALNNKRNVKSAEEELKARGFKKVNGQWVKQ